LPPSPPSPNGMAAATTESMGATTGGPGTGSTRGAEDDADDKGAMRQKTEGGTREDDDKRRAAELLQRQQEAIAAQQASHAAGAGGFGSEAVQATVAQQFVADVCRAVEQARRVGIEPRANGRELVEITPMELRQWIAENLGEESTWSQGQAQCR
jgi:hypothetical protein